MGRLSEDRTADTPIFYGCPLSGVLRHEVTIALELVRDLSARGFLVRPDRGRLRVRPDSALTDELRQMILEHRTELMDLLEDRCSVCVELEETAVLTLICGTCGWQHPKFRVLASLEDYGPLTARQIERITHLDLPVVHKQLGRLYDLGIVGSDESCQKWLRTRQKREGECLD